MPRDKWGNKLTVNEHGIYLKTKSSDREKKVLAFRYGGVIKHIKKNHIMTSLISGPMIGFNYEALKILKTKRVKWIWIMSYAEKTKGKILLKKLLEEGEFLHFKKVGFERQIFYPLVKIKGMENFK